MIIKKVAFGNFNEAYIENRFTNKTNIIFSNENNRGKTLLMQSLVYAIGYESIFPAGFNTRLYYFYLKIEINAEIFEFVRRGNSILVLHANEINMFNTISEFKYYFDKEIYTLPKIDKDGYLKPVDLSLLYELFFLGQDKRNTSNIIIKGQNNKVDFVNMIYSMLGVSVSSIDLYDTQDLKTEKLELESKIKSEKKKITLIRKNPQIASFISATANNLEFKNVANQLKDLHLNIAELKKRRNREENRKAKLETLIAELNSLNRNLSEGKVKCGDCGSSKIIFTNDDFDFDVSNNYVRQNIIISIKNNVELKKDIIIELNNDIEKEQIQIGKLLESNVPEVKNYILFEDEIVDSKEIDLFVSSLYKRVDEIDTLLKNNDVQIVSNKERQRYILNDLLLEMRRLYGIIDPHGLLYFDDIFTKATETYSGSEEQEYYFCKLVALNNLISHDFPIIIDSFREGELSTSKEVIMLREFIDLKKQVILTSTLKKEEYNSNKYQNIANLNVLDYSEIEDSHILQSGYADEFKEILKLFGIEERQ